MVRFAFWPPLTAVHLHRLKTLAASDCSTHER